MSKLFSIRDYLNAFGLIKAPGSTEAQPSPNQLYVGNAYNMSGTAHILDSPSTAEKYPGIPQGLGVGSQTNPTLPAESRGGEIGLPYFVDVTARGATPSNAITITVQGAPEATAASPGVDPVPGSYVSVGELTINSGQWQSASQFRVAISPSRYKFFRLSAVFAAAEPTTVGIDAYLQRA